MAGHETDETRGARAGSRPCLRFGGGVGGGGGGGAGRASSCSYFIRAETNTREQLANKRG